MAAKPPKKPFPKNPFPKEKTTLERLNEPWEKANKIIAEKGFGFQAPKNQKTPEQKIQAITSFMNKTIKEVGPLVTQLVKIKKGSKEQAALFKLIKEKDEIAKPKLQALFDDALKTSLGKDIVSAILPTIVKNQIAMTQSVADINILREKDVIQIGKQLSKVDLNSTAFKKSYEKRFMQGARAAVKPSMDLASSMAGIRPLSDKVINDAIRKNIDISKGIQRNINTLFKPAVKKYMKEQALADKAPSNTLYSYTRKEKVNGKWRYFYD